MNEVFFQGYGRWIGYKSSFPESYFEPGPNYIQQSYTFHTGIFKLPEDSEKAYKHTQKIVTSVLHPNIGHEERARFPCEDIFNCDDPDNVKSPTIETFFKMAMFGTLWFEIDKTQKFILIPANANITNINNPSEPLQEISKKTGRRNLQLDTICKIAVELGYSDLLALPEEAKKKIKTECLKNPTLFSDSGFEHAWKAANKDNLISIQNKKKYLK